MKNKIFITPEELSGRGIFSSEIVYLTGAFDVPHIGHTRYLKKAKELGEVLIVGLRSDEWIKKEKGEERPVNSWDDRAEHIACYEFVDYVIKINSSENMHWVIAKISPNVIVVSETNDKNSGKSPAEMKSFYGSRVVVLPPQAEIHSTDLIRIMRKE